MFARKAVHTPVAYLLGPGKVKVVNRRVIFESASRERTAVDVKSLQALYCYGGISFSDEALARLLEHQVDVAFFDARHRCRGRLLAEQSSSVNTRLAQYEWYRNPAARLAVAREIVAAKIAAQTAAAGGIRRLRVMPGRELSRGIQQLEDAQRRARRARCPDELRGIEGTATRLWFELWSKQLRQPWTFPGRRRRPPTDPVNALLSLAATCLCRRVASAAIADGWELALAALHVQRAGRPSLACDLMEPLRTELVEQWVVRELSRRRLHPASFESTADGGVRLVPAEFGPLLGRWEQHWSDRGGTRQLADQLRSFRRRVTDSTPP